jgi:secreted trypsin-like serine protease
MIRTLAAFALLISCSLPAPAMVGGAPAASGPIARHVVMIVGSRGNACSAGVIAPDLLLTAAHCVHKGVNYKVVVPNAAREPAFKPIKTVMQHPSFSERAFASQRATADVALMQLAVPLPANFVPASIGAARAVNPGDRFMIAGYGLGVPGEGGTVGTLRAANLVATGKPGRLQLRLFDPATHNERPGLGACTGDSGAPVFRLHDGRLALTGVVSWSTAAKNDAGCGGLTGVTPLTLYRAWIVETARKLGSALAE